jgi:hypothetical protein
MSENRLKKENCNKAKCKTCVFGKTPIKLTDARRHEIMLYLSKFKYSHECHTTKLTCYGALEFQARILHAMGTIKEPTPEAFLESAAKVLGFNK